MINVAVELSRLQQTVELVLVSRTGALLYDVPENIKVRTLDASSTFAAVLPLAFYLRKHMPKSLLSPMNHCNVVAVAAALLARSTTRVVIREATAWSMAFRHESSLKWKRLFPVIARHLYPRADQIIALSHGVAEDLSRSLRLPRHRVRTVYNPVPVNQIREKAGEKPDHPWFRPGEAPVIIALGRLIPSKDHATLIEAFAKVRSMRPARLIIGGEGTERSRLERLIHTYDLGQDVLLAGVLVDPFPWLARASVFVSSSRWEGLPNALLEALACGTPVVATDCNYGPREILEHGRFGTLVPVGDVDQMARAIVETINNPPNEKMFEHALSRFQPEKIAREYLEVLVG